MYLNQQDIEERNSQLLRMSAIYRRAAKTIAWLGPSSNHSDKAIQEIGRTTNLKPEDSVPTELQAEVLALLGREYWHRVWIIQEFALSKEVVIMCGSARATCTDIKSTLAVSKTVKGLSHLREIARLRTTIVEDKPVHIYDALYSSQQSRASEPRDKVFALLGLAYNGAAIMPIPNYAQSIPDLCLEMTISAIAMTRSLDVILLGGMSNVKSGPKWQPYWPSLNLGPRAAQRRYKFLTKKLQLRLEPWNGSDLRETRWNATVNTHSYIQLPSHNMLKAKGCVIDEVVCLSSRCSDRHTDERGLSSVPLNDPHFVAKTDHKALHWLFSCLADEEDIFSFQAWLADVMRWANINSDILVEGCPLNTWVKTVWRDALLDFDPLTLWEQHPNPVFLTQ